MADEAALFAAVCADPHDDTPRLVFADFLQETGDPAKVARAEFIRLQCRPDRAAVSREDREASASRQRRLLHRWKREWVAGLPPRVRRAKFLRGFPAPNGWSPTAARFLAATDADLAGAPLWSCEWGWGRDPRFVEAVRSPTLARVDLLFVTARRAPGVPGDHVRALAGSPHARHLRALHLDFEPGAPGLEELAASEHLAHLTGLWPRGNRVGPTAVRTLTTARFAGRLDVLTLNEGAVTADAADALAAGTAFPNLRNLSVLPGYGVPPPMEHDAFEAILRSPAVRTLTSLSVTSVQGTDDRIARAIAESAYLGNLRTLFLTDTAVGEAGALALAESATLARLDTVCMYRNPCARSARAVAALKARFTGLFI